MIDRVWSDARFDLRTWAEKVKDSETFDAPGAALTTSCNDEKDKNTAADPSNGGPTMTPSTAITSLEYDADTIRRLQTALAFLKEKLNDDEHATKIEKFRAHEQVEKTLLKLKKLVGDVHASQETTIKALPARYKVLLFKSIL